MYLSIRLNSIKMSAESFLKIKLTVAQTLNPQKIRQNAVFCAKIVLKVENKPKSNTASLRLPTSLRSRLSVESSGDSYLCCWRGTWGQAQPRRLYCAATHQFVFSCRVKCRRLTQLRGESAATLATCEIVTLACFRRLNIFCIKIRLFWRNFSELKLNRS